MISRIRVAVIDDQPIYRAGLCQLIQKSHSCELVAEGQTCDDAVRIAGQIKPEVMLLDTQIPGCGINALKSISERHKSVRMIVVSNAECGKSLSASVEAGASGYVLKRIDGGRLIDIVSTVHGGRMYMDPTLAADALTRVGRSSGEDEVAKMHGQLTVREREVLRKASTGLTNKEIARVHGLAEKTVKHHMTNIFQKLQARNRVEAIVRGRRYLLDW